MADSKLKIDIRRNAILDILRRDGKVYVTQLSETLRVTPVTIRNDLDMLEAEGHLIRMSGGAVYPNTADEKANVHTTLIHHQREKEAIAKSISKMIKDGDTLFINSGTTTQFIAAELKGLSGLNIVTNSLSVAITLGSVASFRVILLGGEINSQYGFTYGVDAQEKLAHYHADWAILAVDGVGRKNGITTHHAEEAVLDRMMICAADKTIIAADHTKIGRTGFLRVCDCSDEVHIVTDKHEASDELKALIESGVAVTLA